MRSFFLIILSIFLIISCNQEGCNGSINSPVSERPSCFNLKKDTIQGWMEEGIDCGGPCITCEVKADKELIITSNDVVDNDAAKGGKLSFGYLIENLAGNKEDGGILIKSLFDNWSNRTPTFTVPNTFSTAPNRPNVDLFLNRWKDIDGDTGTLENWVPNLDNAPFRLLGITNRIDLKDTINNSSGEGRFTYCINPELFPNDNSAFFNIIFEYNLPGKTTDDCSRWVNKWHSLSEDSLSKAQYIEVLTSVTDSFVLMNELNQLRTNDFIFEKVWELREFKHNKSSNSFESHFLSKTPDIRFNNQDELSSAVTQLQNEIDNNLNYEFEESMRAASAVPNTANQNAINNPGFTWDIPNVNSNLEFLSSLNTCNGCHMGHGDNAGLRFMHMKPRKESEQVEISGRLSNIDRTARVANMKILLGVDSTLILKEMQSLTDSEIVNLTDFINSHVSGH